MSEDDLMRYHRQKIDEERSSEKKERVGFSNPTTWFLISGMTGAFALLLRKGNRGHDL